MPMPLAPFATPNGNLLRMRSLDLYSEKQIRDGSPDKIAASTALVREANSLSLNGLTKDSPMGQVSSAGDKKGLLSVFSTDVTDTTVKGQQRDKMALASIALCNPLLLLGMGATFAITDELKRREDQAQADQGVFAERMQRVIARQAFLLKEAKEKAEKGSDGTEQINDTTIMSALAASKKLKMAFIKDKVSIARGAKASERNLQPKQPVDYLKQNKLLKKKQFLVDYLEKFRGKLSLQEVSEVISQMEKLDKALLLMAS
jgi:hypothetical protein